MIRRFIIIKGDGKGKFKVFNHKKDELGQIKYYQKWKRYKQWVFYPNFDTFFTAGCLKEIEEILERLNKGGEK